MLTMKHKQEYLRRAGKSALVWSQVKLIEALRFLVVVKFPRIFQDISSNGTIYYRILIAEDASITVSASPFE